MEATGEAMEVIENATKELAATLVDHHQAVALFAEILKVCNIENRDGYLSEAHKVFEATQEEAQQVIALGSQVQKLESLSTLTLPGDNAIHILASYLWSDKSPNADVCTVQQQQLVTTLNACATKQQQCCNTILRKSRNVKNALQAQIADVHRTVATSQRVTKKIELFTHRRAEAERSLNSKNTQLEELKKKSKQIDHWNAKNREKLREKAKVFEEAAAVLHLHQDPNEPLTKQEQVITQGIESLYRLAGLTKQLSRVVLRDESSFHRVYDIYDNRVPRNAAVRVEITGLDNGPLQVKSVPLSPQATDYAKHFQSTLVHALSSKIPEEAVRDVVHSVTAFLDVTPELIASTAQGCLDSLEKQCETRPSVLPPILSELPS